MPDLGNYTTLPPQVRASLLFLAGGSIMGLLFAFDKRVGMIAVIGLFSMGCLLVFYKRVLAWFAKKRGVQMSGQITEHAGAAPMGVNDPAKRARLDDLKRNFDSGLAKFQTSGKDVYKLPWYLIVGEPGSGKTEAVRHCNVGFPPGLQDELQGAGGTINMNWWFTNHAVMLDTAGRLMFEEIKPGESSEWREFLQLLRRNRPNCPVNGLLLVIPAESLIRDTTDDISKKAGKIAQQLDVIQRTLDVRFPVFILITKCDLLSGFREFFEGLNNPQTQHQMIGWTNPEPRDAVFQPSKVTDYLQTVVDRVSKRRLGLLRDPVPEKEGGKRADEVDALYGLPHSLSLIGPRLRSYLETIFVAGEWSAKPLFLRGIYFTSAMREGAALDQELAQALGVALDDLPEGRAWERERAYFLRDMFMEKAFREKGLVTRATNTNKLVRRRRLFLYGSGILAFLALLGLSYAGYMSLKESVGQQSLLWGQAKQNWNTGVWHPIVERDPSGKAVYKGDQPVSPVDKMTLSEYHSKIRELCEKDIEIGWIFRPMARFTRLEGDRKKAQRILFEGGVINPLVKETRRMMTDPARDAIPADVSTALVREAEGLATLINIESDTVSHKSNIETLPDGFVTPLLRYTTGLEKPADPAGFRELSNTLIWTYTKNPNGKWPPPWLSAGASLATNRPIAAGLDRMIRFITESLKTQEAGIVDIRTIRDLLRNFRQKETEMNATVVASDPLNPDKRGRDFAKMKGLMEELGAIKLSLDKAVKDHEHNLAAGQSYTASHAYEQLIGQSRTQSAAAIEIVQKSVADYVAKGNDPINTNYPLFVQVDAKLKDLQADISKRIAGGFNDQEKTELTALDQSLLAGFGNGKRCYEVRWATYKSSQDQISQSMSTNKLIGENWAPFVTAQGNIDRQRQSVSSLKEKLPDPFAATCSYFCDWADEFKASEALTAYVNESKSKFDDSFHYPLVREPGGRGEKSIRGAESLLGQWKRDLTSNVFTQMKRYPNKAKLERFLSALQAINLSNASGGGSVTVTILSYERSPDKSGVSHFRKAAIGGREFDTSTESASESYSYSGSFSAEFFDFSVSPQKRVGFSRSISSLLSETKGVGGRVEIHVEGLPIFLEVTPKGSPPPDPEKLPDKKPILDTLT